MSRFSGIESLESRRLLSAAAFVGPLGVLHVNGSPRFSNQIVVDNTPDGQSVSVSITFVNAKGVQTIDKTFAISGIKSVYVKGGASADIIDVGQSTTAAAFTLPTRVDGIGGADTIKTGPESDTINGGSGPDIISSGDGNDIVRGGNGIDQITVGNGNDKVRGGKGRDVIVAGDGTDTVVGGNGADTITVGNGNDLVFGGPGNDTINAGNGNDTLWGGAGNDDIHAGTGNDTFGGVLGQNTLIGAAGADNVDTFVVRKNFPKGQTTSFRQGIDVLKTVSKEAASPTV